jgi:hypothetical protein
VTWYAFSGLNGGQAIDLAGSQEKEATSLGFHGYATAAAAQANPNSTNLLTRYAADAFIADYKAAVAEQAQPGGTNANILNPATAVSAGATGVASEAKNLIPGVGDIDDLINFVKQGNIWERGAEIVAGLILLYVGIKAIATPTGQSPGQRSVKDTAKRIAEVAAK